MSWAQTEGRVTMGFPIRLHVRRVHRKTLFVPRRSVQLTVHHAVPLMACVRVMGV
jgi:hypothetical protein